MQSILESDTSMFRVFIRCVHISMYENVSYGKIPIWIITPCSFMIMTITVTNMMIVVTNVMITITCVMIICHITSVMITTTCMMITTTFMMITRTYVMIDQGTYYDYHYKSYDNHCRCDDYPY